LWVYLPISLGIEVDPGAGDRLAELYRWYIPDMVRLAYVVTGDASVAEDIAQDAFIRAAGRFAYMRNESAFQFYLRRTVVNLCKNHFRRRDRERRFARSHPPEETHDPHATTETHEIIRVALLRLPERQRTAIALRHFEDLSVDEAARVMRCRPGTVKALTSRGLDALRATLTTEADSA
jgi:RNA polymerase sigma-70 factor (sigma-E family)